MKKAITPLTALPPTGMGAVDKAWDAVSISFDRFCLTAGIEALGTMMEHDAEQACGARHARGDGRRGHLNAAIIFIPQKTVPRKTQKLASIFGHVYASRIFFPCRAALKKYQLLMSDGGPALKCASRSSGCRS